MSESWAPGNSRRAFSVTWMCSGWSPLWAEGPAWLLPESPPEGAGRDRPSSVWDPESTWRTPPHPGSPRLCTRHHCCSGPGLLVTLQGGRPGWGVPLLSSGCARERPLQEDGFSLSGQRTGTGTRRVPTGPQCAPLPGHRRRPRHSSQRTYRGRGGFVGTGLPRSSLHFPVLGLVGSLRWACGCFCSPSTISDGYRAGAAL